MTAAAPIRGTGHRATAVETGPGHRVLQRKCACGGETQAGGECATCRKKRQGVLHRSAQPRTSARQDEAPAIVHDVLRTAGEPLERGARAMMESRFGHDFSTVRVHTDDHAAASARAVDAAAYTVGTHVVFGSGSYDPRSRDGQHLLAHELAHVRQQAGASAPDAASPLSIGPVSSRHELEANAVAARAMTGTAPAFDATPAGPLLQRQPVGAPTHDDSHTAFKPNTPYVKYSESSEAMYRRAGRSDVADAVRRCREMGADACTKLLTTEEARALYQQGRVKAQLPPDVTVGGPALALAPGVGRVFAPPVVTPPVVTPPVVAPPVVTPPPIGPAGAVVGVTAVEVATIAIPVVGAVMLTLAVIDLVNYGKFETALRREGYIVMPSPLGVCIGLCHTAVGPTGPQWQRAPAPTFPKSQTDVDPATAKTLEDWIRTAPTQKPKEQPKPAPDIDSPEEEQDEAGCVVRSVAMKFGRWPCHADYAMTFSGVRREFEVRAPKLPPVDFDARDLAGNLYEVKTGYAFVLNNNLSPEWQRRRQEVIARFQVQASIQQAIARRCRRRLEWYFNNKLVAEFFAGLIEPPTKYRKFDCDVDSDHLW